MKINRILFIISAVILLAAPAEAYRLLTDKINGGNPKLDKKIYKVYIEADPTSNNRDQEVKEALDKWKAELGPKGVDLQVQAGSPPQTPIDLDKFNQQVKDFNDQIKMGQSPDVSDFSEIKKLDDKNCTISVYFRTSSEIGGGSERGKANNFWNLDANFKADKIDAADILLPTDPPGATEEVKKRILHNIAMHEFGHMAGTDHYTPAQISKGDIMENDATLHSTKLDLSGEEKKALDTIYGPTPTLKIESKADNKQSSILPQDVQDSLPAGLADVWEYNYDLVWEEGSPVTYFQVHTGSFPVFYAQGSSGLEDWVVHIPSADERFLEFYADQNYLGDNTLGGSLKFYSSAEPGFGELAYAGGAIYGMAPVPEPAALLMFSSGLAGIFLRKRLFIN